MPGSEHPEPPNPEEHTTKDMTNVKPAELTESEYHEIADQYINTLVLSMEEMADKDTGKGLEVEYSVSTLYGFSLAYSVKQAGSFAWHT